MLCPWSAQELSVCAVFSCGLGDPQGLPAPSPASGQLGRPVYPCLSAFVFAQGGHRLLPPPQKTSKNVLPVAGYSGVASLAPGRPAGRQPVGTQPVVVGASAGVLALGRRAPPAVQAWWKVAEEVPGRQGPQLNPLSQQRNNGLDGLLGAGGAVSTSHRDRLLQGTGTDLPQPALPILFFSLLGQAVVF